MDRAGFVTYNGGMSGTDPNQYAHVARRFIPIIRPDVVCVSFYMANDIMHRKFDAGPFEDLFHITNAGWLNPFLEYGEHIPTPQECYDYYITTVSIPNTDRNVFNRLMSKTVLTTRLWTILPKLGIVKNLFDDEVQERRDKAKPFAVTIPSP